jgi:hypothetical protein
MEVLALGHQLTVLQRSVKRPKLTPADRLLWATLAEFWQDWRSALMIVRPETVISWHRKGYRLFWTWKSRRRRAGRPAVSAETRQLIRTMSRDNPLWGAPRIHGELLKLGIDVSETSVSKYIVRNRKPPSHTWKTFLENHLKTVVSVDFFTVPTIRFQILYVFLVLAHDRRRILHVAVTAHPTAMWTAQPLREAFPWDSGPQYLLRDRDRIFGRVHGTAEAFGYPGSAGRAARTGATGVYRAGHWDHSAGAPGPSDRVLSRDAQALVFGEGHAGAPTGARAGVRWSSGDPAGWWLTSSIRAASSVGGGQGSNFPVRLAARKGVGDCLSLAGVCTRT